MCFSWGIQGALLLRRLQDAGSSIRCTRPRELERAMAAAGVTNSLMGSGRCCRLKSFQGSCSSSMNGRRCLGCNGHVVVRIRWQRRRGFAGSARSASVVWRLVTLLVVAQAACGEVKVSVPVSIAPGALSAYWCWRCCCLLWLAGSSERWCWDTELDEVVAGIGAVGVVDGVRARRGEGKRPRGVVLVTWSSWVDQNLLN